MSKDWEKTLPKELQDYIEAERQSARAAAIAEIRLGKVELSSGQKIQPAKQEIPSEPKLNEDRATPRGLGFHYVAEAIQPIQAGTIITTTDVRTLIFQAKKTLLSFNTVRRAMEKLCNQGQLERIENTDGFRVLTKLRSVK